MSPLNYQLLKNHLTTGADDYTARVRPTGSANLDDVVNCMIKQKGSTAVRGDVLSFLEDLFSAVEGLLEAGRNVNIPLVSLHLSIQGKFTGPTDSFDPLRHQVTVQATAGPRLRKTLAQNTQVAQDTLARPLPIVTQYVDVARGSANQTLTPGGQGCLVGKRLKFNPADPTQGVFFRAADGTVTRATSYAWAGTRKVILLVPPLAPGEYTLEVRAAFGQEVHGGELLEKLIVA